MATRTTAAQTAGRSERDDRLEDLERAYIGALLVLSEAADARTEYRPGHARRSGELAAQVARALGLPEDEIEAVRYGAILHDVGQLGVPEEILRSPCPLTADEWRLIRTHPAAGAQMLAVVPRLASVAKIVGAHHERWDGRGYPLGLGGERIPLGARIVAVVDAYLAMIEHRPYRLACGPAEAMAEVRRRAGTQFDPGVVDALVDVLAGRAAPAGDVSTAGAAHADAAAGSGAAPSGQETPGADDRRWQPLRENLTRLLRPGPCPREGAAQDD